MSRTLSPSPSTNRTPGALQRSSARAVARRSSIIGMVIGLALALTAGGTASAVSYQGYSGDFNGGFLTCLNALGVVGITNPATISIANDDPATFFETQRLWTTSMLYHWDGSKWASASGWTNWRYTDYNEDLDPSLSNWQEWTGSTWIQESSPPSWTGLSSGYYSVITWIYFGARPGIVGPGWAYSWPTPLSQGAVDYCQI
jgi:hypothetical protein